MSVKIAFALQHGVELLTHLGHAEEFAVYEAKGDELAFVETRASTAFCSENGHDFLADFARGLSDCRVVFADAAGPCGREALEAHGIEVFEFSGTVATVIRQISQTGFLKRLGNFSHR
jgi:nitrogen fixation protein NifB